MIGGRIRSVDYKEILKKVKQEDIFYLAFGFYPELGKRYYSPFRSDNDPGCRFEWSGDLLYFYDNAGYNGKIRFTAFDAIQIIHNKSSLPEACKFIEKQLSINASTPPIVKHKPRPKREVKIGFTYHQWTNENNIFKDYYLTKDHLNDDSETFLVKDYWANTKTDPVLMRNRFSNPHYFPTVAYHLNGRTKLYWPTKKTNKWYSNCSSSDIFDQKLINQYSNEYIIVSKSKKDNLVFKYLLNKQVISQQSELPDLYIANELKRKFKKVYVMYDNDEPGQRTSKVLCDKYGFINIKIPDLRTKDISDYVKTYGVNEAKKLLNDLL